MNVPVAVGRGEGVAVDGRLVVDGVVVLERGQVVPRLLLPAVAPRFRRQQTDVRERGGSVRATR